MNMATTTAAQLTAGTSVYVPAATGNASLRVKLTVDAIVNNAGYAIVTGYRVYRNSGRMSDAAKTYVAHVSKIMVLESPVTDADWQRGYNDAYHVYTGNED
jgi:hypothetical protein